VNLLFVEEEEQNVSKHGESGHDVWVSAAGFVFEQACVLPPVVAYFDATPMTADKLQPLLWRVGIGRER